MPQTNYSNMNTMQPQGNQQMPYGQYPYGNNNYLMNTPYENYNMGRQQPMQQNLSNQFLKCRPVSSREEAMAFQIDLDGSLWVFPNVANHKIYTKQINNDGTATFNTYDLVKNENPFNSSEYVTKDQLNQVVQNIMAAIGPTNTGTASAHSNEQKQMDF